MQFTKAGLPAFTVKTPNDAVPGTKGTLSKGDAALLAIATHDS